MAIPKPDLPLFHWSSFFPNAQVVYITSVEVANAEFLRLWTVHPYSVVGFDLEWKPKFHKQGRDNPVALVQIGFEDTILLVQVSAMPVFPRCLLDFLASPHVYKVGVNIQNDCKKLFKDYGVSVCGCVDLSLLARSCDPQWKGPYSNDIGLSRLTSTYLGLRLSKGPVRTSNWESELTPLQVDYAANDCTSALVVYYKLMARLIVMDPTPDAECFMFDVIGGALRVTGDPVGRLWFPYNPQYDPGPPPIRKIDSTAEKDSEMEKDGSGESA